MSAPEALTYDSLVSDVSTYCERTDEPFLAQISSYVLMAENRIASVSKPLGFMGVVTGSLNSNTLAKPSRWRMTKSFSILVASERSFLFSREYEYCRTYAPTSGATGVPRYYADYDYENFFIAPTPATAYDFELLYYERPEPLSAVNQTNWNTQYAPQMLLYATLMEAMPFLKASERIPEFQGLYDRALAAIVGEDQQRVTDSSEQRGKK